MYIATVLGYGECMDLSIWCNILAELDEETLIEVSMAAIIMPIQLSVCASFYSWKKVHEFKFWPGTWFPCCAASFIYTLDPILQLQHPHS